MSADGSQATKIKTKKEMVYRVSALGFMAAAFLAVLALAPAISSSSGGASSPLLTSSSPFAMPIMVSDIFNPDMPMEVK
jgi:hypothetical protein